MKSTMLGRVFGGTLLGLAVYQHAVGKDTVEAIYSAVLACFLLLWNTENKP